MVRFEFIGEMDAASRILKSRPIIIARLFLEKLHLEAFFLTLYIDVIQKPITLHYGWTYLACYCEGITLLLMIDNSLIFYFRHKKYSPNRVLDVLQSIFKC